MSLVPGTRLGPYEILAQIGVGGMGEVYRATDTNLKRDVAIKVLPAAVATDPDRLARFQREAQVLAVLNHPNIAQIHGLEKADGVTALVMELVDGPTLADRIARGPIPLDDALPMARQIAEALEAAHEHGIIHRDLKPANVKVTPGGQVKVLDFGLAKALVDEMIDANQAESPTITSPATRAGVILGTPAYMAPEQARGQPVDRRLDIWAFGVVLYEMLSGTRGFDRETAAETLTAVMKENLDWTRLPPETPAPLRRLLMRCLEKDPRRRLRDIGEARVTLEQPDAEAIERKVMPSSMRTVGGRWPWIVGGIATGALLLIGILNGGLWSKSPDVSVVRSTILPPDQVPFNFSADYNFGPPAISPDGSRLVFSAQGPDGRIHLRTRPLDVLITRELAGTDGGTYPFWSADSQNIGFFADKKLKRIPASGGEVVPLADVTNGRGGTWNRDDVILFTPGYRTLIQRVSAKGGAANPVTVFDATKHEESNRFPWFLPDGHHFLYTAQRVTQSYTKSTIRLGSLDSKESTIIVDDADSNVVYASGYLLYLVGGTLVGHPFDQTRLTLTGEPVPVVDGVRSVVITSCGVFSASENGRLVYQSGAPDTTRSKLTWWDRSGQRLNAVGEAGPLSIINFSSDRLRAAVEIDSTPSGTNRLSDIWIYDVASGRRDRFTFQSSEKAGAVWSQDGETLIFGSRRNGAVGPFDLYRQLADHSRPEELLYSDDANKAPMSLRRDGKFLLYSATNLGKIMVLPDPLSATPGKPFAFMNTSSTEAIAQFSPDGQWVAYQSNESVQNEIYIARFPDSGGKTQISTTGGTRPRWRSDGKEIFYISAGRLMAAEVVHHGSALERGEVRTITTAIVAGDSTYRGYSYDVSADGQRFLVVSAPEQKAVDPLTFVQNWTMALKR